MGPDSPLDDPKGDVARQPLWKRRVPTPVLLAVIIAGILAFSALWLPARDGFAKVLKVKVPGAERLCATTQRPTRFGAAAARGPA